MSASLTPAANGHDPWLRLRQLRDAEHAAERAWQAAREEEQRLRRLLRAASARVASFIDTGEEEQPLFAGLHEPLNEVVRGIDQRAAKAVPQAVCVRCKTPGRLVAQPSAFVERTDVCSLDMCDLDLVCTPLGISEDEAPETFVCATCHAELIEPKPTPKKGKTRKAKPLPMGIRVVPVAATPVGLCPNCGVRVDDDPDRGPDALCDLCRVKARSLPGGKPVVCARCNRPCGSVDSGGHCLACGKAPEGTKLVTGAADEKVAAKE